SFAEAFEELIFGIENQTYQGILKRLAIVVGLLFELIVCGWSLFDRFSATRIVIRTRRTAVAAKVYPFQNGLLTSRANHCPHSNQGRPTSRKLIFPSRSSLLENAVDQKVGSVIC